MSSPEPQAGTPSPPAPSFEGRLKLKDFIFQTTKSPKERETSIMAVRRSPRLLQPSRSATSSPLPSPSQTRSRSATSRTPAVSKRKAASPPPDDNNDDNIKPRLTSVSASPSPARSSSTPRPTKRNRPPSSYAPPSTYAHLSPLPDAIAPHLLILFIGLNPGISTARQQHAYAHPSNLFWKLLYSSGITPRLVHPSEDRTLPQDYSLGITNIVSRPSRNGAELSKAEMDAGVEVLEGKVRRWRPEVVCVVGKSIWESIWRVRHGRAIKKEEYRYGWQEDGERMGVVGPSGQTEDEKEEGLQYGEGAWEGARVFVSSSTSGLAATLRPHEKEAIWKPLGEWCAKRRAERSC